MNNNDSNCSHKNQLSNKDNPILYISVPTQLISFLEKCSNTFIKGISVWLILKAETPTGIIHGYRKQLPALAHKCKVSVLTLDKYILWRISQDQLHIHNKDLFLHAYQSLKKLGIDIEKRLVLPYDLNDRQAFSDILLSSMKTVQ